METNTLSAAIGTAAREARRALSLTQEDIADRIGISTEFYSRIERGKTLPSVPTLVRMIDALQTNAEAILGRISNPPDAPLAEGALQQTAHLPRAQVVHLPDTPDLRISLVVSRSNHDAGWTVSTVPQLRHAREGEEQR